eukprot:gnl/TRDRNA2_/TRDRNA2_122390_c2_seq2.p1 gnl/TRDRNA2_/TRDRNA2_122390_c2~~gnl/TRDRNA2_/TRDRNA2_122390_c2_seq2.p1  ORF type:complete len:141 (+),score=42.03 gnl/TRDRNA2_/TRDRNA2_122390_c2_seq2:291-713(+)
MLIAVRMAWLGKRLGLSMHSTYKELEIKAGKVAQVMLRVPGPAEDGTGTDVAWDWTLELMNVNFRAHFLPAGASDDVTWEELQSVDRHEAASGPLVGGFVPSRAGTLRLVWDNQFSWARSKKIFYHVSPPDLEDAAGALE